MIRDEACFDNEERVSAAVFHFSMIKDCCGHRIAVSIPLLVAFSLLLCVSGILRISQHFGRAIYLDCRDNDLKT